MLRPRTHLRHLTPYELPARSAKSGVEPLQLAQNENYAAASEHAIFAAREACAESSRYPDPDATGLRSAIADLHGLQSEKIVCARGAMELISLLAAGYLEPGSDVVTSEFGYMYFRSAAELAGARVIEAPEPGFIVDSAAIARSVTDSTRLVFLANPGNPTGSFLPKSALAELRRLLPDSVVLVIDEAYAEFVEPNRYRSCFDMVEEGATVVLRTFSKIYGLAGLRVGWGYFPLEIASLVRVVQQPNGVTGPSQAAATAAIRDQRHVDELRARTITIRNDFARSLRALGFNPLPSEGNFVLVGFDSPSATASADAHLRTDAIVVRGMNGYRLPECLRITLGTEEQMQRVVCSLERWVETQ